MMKTIEEIPVTLIAAVADNGVIGINNKLPWHLPEDLAHFKKLTTGKPIIMGRNTFESLPSPLPNRLNIVISTQKITANGFLHADTLTKALELATHYCLEQESVTEKEIMVIGGAQLYKATLNIAKKMYITQVHITPTGDTYFNEWKSDQWTITKKEGPFEAKVNDISYTFLILNRT